MDVTVDVKDNSENKEEKYWWDQKVVEAFRSLIKDEKGLRSRVDDTFLLSCLRARKYDSQRALQLVKNYYISKRRYPHLSQNIDSPVVEKSLKTDVIGYLPYTDNLGRLIFIYRADKWDINELLATDIACLGLLYEDLLLNINLVQVNGVIILLDMSSLSMAKVMKFTPTLAYQLITAVTGACPVSCKEFHIINFSSLFFTVCLKFLFLLPSKIFKRVHIHSDLDSLHQYISKKYLPSDFGGEMPPIDFTHCRNDLRNNKQYFRENQKYWLSSDEDEVMKKRRLSIV